MSLVDAGEGSVTVAGLWTYCWDAPRPFLHPVRTPAGHVITRDAPPDHVWHHGLWFTIKYVNEENYWEEEPGTEYGTLRDAGPSIDEPGDGTVTITSDLTWVRPDGETVVIDDHRVLRHLPIDDASYAIDFEITLVPRVHVVLDRTPYTFWGGYGGLTLRGPGDVDEPKIVLADGSKHQQVLGTASEWLDISWTAAGGSGAVAGAAILDHPGNPRHPTPWYASTKNELYFTEDWTNFANAAFLWDDAYELAAGESLTIRHRAVVHDGSMDPSVITSIASAWTAAGD